MATKKKSGKRLSSLFSLGALNNSTVPPVPTEKQLTPPAHATDLPMHPFLDTEPHQVTGAGWQASNLRARPISYSAVPVTISRKPLPHARTESLTIPLPLPPPVAHKSQPGSPAGSRRTSTTSNDANSYSPISLPMAQKASSSSPVELSKKAKRRTWLYQEKKTAAPASDPRAWVLGHTPKLIYDIDAVLDGHKVRVLEGLALLRSIGGNADTDAKVCELWDDTGDVFVYLHPKSTGKGPSFRVHSTILGASPALDALVRGRNRTTASKRRDSKQEMRKRADIFNLSCISTPPLTPELRARQDDDSSLTTSSTRATSESLDSNPDELVHLHLPLDLSHAVCDTAKGKQGPDYAARDKDLLMAARNMFSFLIGGSLVATTQRSSMFLVFLQVAEMLNRFGFTNVDGSTFGEVANLSFEGYVEELQLADVRGSCQKTVEAIVLGERMRCSSLYREGFTHAVGKYEELKELRETYNLLSPISQSRLERAALDLEIRCKNLGTRLEGFEFPSLFSGLMASRTDHARKHVNFDTWRSSFMATRRFLLSYYRNKFGSWPPRAKSKKNTLETSGLNRLVLRDLYHDMTALYDLLVNRESLTTRGLDGNVEDELAKAEPFSMVLRRVLHEYDSSTPPVQPAVPYDVPILFDLTTIRGDHRYDAAKQAKARTKKLKEEELVALLRGSVNQDANISLPFIDAFKEFEHKSLHGKNVIEMCNVRCGEWIFIYAVLQALPMLIIDAPGVRWTQGVEYFLCEAPLSAVPWAREDRGLQRNWYGVASGGVVSLPAAVVENGVEGVYRRSHCWKMASRWSGESEILAAAVHESLHDPLPMPPGLLSVEPGSRPGSSNGSRSKRSSVVNLGLEALPIPSGVAPPSPSMRSVSAPVDASRTFDAILGPAAAPPQKPGKKRR